MSTQGNRIERVQSAHWLMHTEARVVRAKREEELDKRISMVVKVINSQVWPSYCPALYPPIVWRRLDYHIYVYTGYIYLLNELYSLSKQILRRFDGVILVDPLCAVGANFFLRAMDRYEVQRGTIRLRNREEHANENSRSVSIDRRIVLLINAFARSPCYYSLFRSVWFGNSDEFSIDDDYQ